GPEPTLLSATCLLCSRQFKPISSRAMYCSKDCANQAHSIRMMGKGNSNYSGRSDRPYVGTLWQRLAPLIRELDGNRCTTCGEEVGDANDRDLPVHHIDENPKNNMPENLITLCQACHMTHHKSKEPPFCLSTSRLKAEAERRWRSTTSGLKETI